MGLLVYIGDFNIAKQEGKEKSLHTDEVFTTLHAFFSKHSGSYIDSPPRKADGEEVENLLLYPIPHLSFFLPMLSNDWGITCSSLHSSLNLATGVDPHGLSEGISPPSNKSLQHISIKSVMPLCAIHGQCECDHIHEGHGEVISRRHTQL